MLKKPKSHWMLGVSLSIFVIAAGCSNTPSKIPLPSCDTPPAITDEVWNDIDQLRAALSRDALIYEDCISKYRARIEAFNENR